MGRSSLHTQQLAQLPLQSKFKISSCMLQWSQLERALRGVLGGIRSLVLDLDLPTRIGSVKCSVLHVSESLRYEPLMIHLAVSEVCGFTGAVPCLKWTCKLPENKSVFHKVLLSPLDAFCLGDIFSLRLRGLAYGAFGRRKTR